MSEHRIELPPEPGSRDEDDSLGVEGPAEDLPDGDAEREEDLL